MVVPIPPWGLSWGTSGIGFRSLFGKELERPWSMTGGTAPTDGESGTLRPIGLCQKASISHNFLCRISESNLISYRHVAEHLVELVAAVVELVQRRDQDQPSAET